jgi:quercetin dioxygenase-like cupin family protein
VESKSVLREADFSQEKMKKVGLFETERLFCDVYGFEPGQEQKPHTHAASDKVYYVLQGTGTFQIGRESVVLQEGQIIMAPAGSEHGVKNGGPGRMTLLVFMAPRP